VARHGVGDETESTLASGSQTAGPADQHQEASCDTPGSDVSISSPGWHITAPPPAREGWSLSSCIGVKGDVAESAQTGHGNAYFSNGPNRTGEEKDSMVAQHRGRKRGRGAQCPSCCTAMSWAILIWIAYSFYETYQAFSPELCDLAKETPSMRGSRVCALFACFTCPC
jgi:hypothetical protein